MRSRNSELEPPDPTRPDYVTLGKSLPFMQPQGTHMQNYSDNKSFHWWRPWPCALHAFILFVLISTIHTVYILIPFYRRSWGWDTTIYNQVYCSRPQFVFKFKTHCTAPRSLLALIFLCLVAPNTILFLLLSCRGIFLNHTYLASYYAI